MITNGSPPCRVRTFKILVKLLQQATLPHICTGKAPFAQVIRLVQHLSKPLEVQYENIRQGPQAEFDPTLLELPAMGAAPGIIWGQLEGIQEEDEQNQSEGFYILRIWLFLHFP